MKTSISLKYGMAVLSLAAGALVPTLATAQTQAAGTQGDKWQTSASLYFYFPSIGGTTKFPAGSGGSSIGVDADKVIDNLKMAFMGTLDIHNGRWGLLNDVMYLDLGGSKSGTRDFSLGNSGIPAGASASLNQDLKGTIWTVAGEYRLATGNPAYTVDLLGGARMFNLKETLGYSVSGVVGSHPLVGTSGSVEVSDTNWDAIVGVKGRYAFGANRQWFAPYYLDVGTGQSKMTWQAAGGVGYAFNWGEVTALWRYLAYDMKSGKAIESVNFNGPMVGATFRW